ncbi:MAG: DUF4332 domain-containing protein [Candidatus Promineofilum sp.]|nr:DUF4332 domain-containing protein [Promineifilum sp.]
MNFWTGLILGIIIGWVVEWLIDWLFWRRDAEEAQRADLLAGERLAVDPDRAWDDPLANAEQDYQTRLRAVEADWQNRLNINEQQWQSQFVALEDDNKVLRAQMAGAALGPVAASPMIATLEEEEALDLPDEALFVDEIIVAEPAAEDIDLGRLIFDDVDPAGDFGELAGIDDDLAERFHLAGIDSIDTLAAADPTTLSVATGLERDETESWIDRAVAALPSIEATAAAPAASPSDDLTRIHGIGPKYAAVLAQAGILSFDDLAQTTPDQLRDIIKPSAMQQINFDSWAGQAVALAHTRSSRTSDDLTQLEGIGPVYAAKLRDRGITTFADLAAADEATLSEIVGAPAWRRINYGEWIAQAKLAADGDAIALHELQSRLFRRSGDNLNLIRGMGQRSATALQAAGITTFTALAESTPQRLDEILRGAGVRGGFDYELWIDEAGSRAAGKRIPAKRARAIQIASCPQDLSAVTGIGSVFEERLYAAGVGSYWALAELADERLAAILDAQSFQDIDLGAIKASAMQLAAQTNALGRTWDGTPPDDFDRLPGIGQVYERRLYEAGICTYEAMAAATPGQLADICRAPAMRTPDYQAWIATAAELSAARSD